MEAWRWREMNPARTYDQREVETVRWRNCMEWLKRDWDEALNVWVREGNANNSTGKRKSFETSWRRFY